MSTNLDWKNIKSVHTDDTNNVSCCTCTFHKFQNLVVSRVL